MIKARRIKKNKMANQILKTVYFDADLDHALMCKAFDMRRQRNDLVNEYVRIGMNVGLDGLKHQAEIEKLQGQIETLLNTIEKLVG
jgi:hypothetical protein